jgi:hypothetical protein
MVVALANDQYGELEIQHKYARQRCLRRNKPSAHFEHDIALSRWKTRDMIKIALRFTKLWHSVSNEEDEFVKCR